MNGSLKLPSVLLYAFMFGYIVSNSEFSPKQRKLFPASSCPSVCDTMLPIAPRGVGLGILKLNPREDLDALRP